MAVANFKIRKKTNSSDFFTLVAIFGLAIGSVIILWYEYKTKPEQMAFIVAIYALLTIGAYTYSKLKKYKEKV